MRDILSTSSRPPEIKLGGILRLSCCAFFLIRSLWTRWVDPPLPPGRYHSGHGWLRRPCREQPRLEWAVVVHASHGQEDKPRSAGSQERRRNPGQYFHHCRLLKRDGTASGKKPPFGIGFRGETRILTRVCAFLMEMSRWRDLELVLGQLFLWMSFFVSTILVAVEKLRPAPTWCQMYYYASNDTLSRWLPLWS